MELDQQAEPQSKQTYVLLGAIAAILLGICAIGGLLYIYLVLPA